jgi:hypothetical protein
MKFKTFLISLFVASGNCFADIDCTGTVESLSVQLSTHGTITLSLSGGPSYVYICNLDGATANGVSFETCKAMYSTLLAAKLSGKKMKIRFYGYESCGSVPSWAYPGALGWTQVLLD